MQSWSAVGVDAVVVGESGDPYIGASGELTHGEAGGKKGQNTGFSLCYCAMFTVMMSFIE